MPRSRPTRSTATLARWLVAALVVTVLPALLSPPPAYAAFARLYAPTLVPIAGQPFTLHGKITSNVKRPVKLQRVFSSGRATTIARTTATKKGTFTFRGVTIPETSTLRALAPKFRGDLNNPKVQVATAPVVVRTVRQSGRLAAVPPIVQPGTSPAAPSTTGHVVAGFTPARPGRPVRLEQLTKKRWVVTARSRQDRGGFATFPVPPGRTYRAVTPATRQVPEVTTGTARSRSFSTAFSDTFDGSALDVGVWTDRPAEGAETQGRRTCARIDGSVRSVGDGTLKLGVGLDPARAGETCAYETARYGPGASPYLLNSQIDSREAYHFTHGWAAARVRWQQPDGMHGGFWLLPINGKIPGRPDLGTEVDVVEHFGNGTLKGGIGGFLHYLDETGADVPLAADHLPTARLKPRGDRWWSSYHVFSVEWTPQEYVFRVDGREFWREDRAVSQAGEYLVLSMLTSDYELRDLAPSELSETASVDWVRVWQS